MGIYRLRETIFEELRRAVNDHDEVQVKIIRDIIKCIKIHQIEIKDFATDESVLKIVTKLANDKQSELDYLQNLLKNSSSVGSK